MSAALSLPTVTCWQRIRNWQLVTISCGTVVNISQIILTAVFIDFLSIVGFLSIASISAWQLPRRRIWWLYSCAEQIRDVYVRQFKWLWTICWDRTWYRSWSRLRWCCMWTNNGRTWTTQRQSLLKLQLLLPQPPQFHIQQIIKFQVRQNQPC